MNEFGYGIERTQESVLATNKVLRNTYMLLAMTLIFSAFTAAISMVIGIGQGLALILMLISFGLLFWVHKAAESSQGIIAIFAFTGCLGAALGPMLSYYVAVANGPGIVLQALGGTGLIFFTLSGYALTTRKDFSFMRGFLFTGLIVAIVAIILNLFLNIPLLSLVISAAVIMIMSGLILFDTSRIIHGGEKNYIRATVSLYLNIYNIFIHLLHLISALTGRN